MVSPLNPGICLYLGRTRCVGLGVSPGETNSAGGSRFWRDQEFGSLVWDITGPVRNRPGK